MALDKDSKLAAIEASRGRLEHELYNAGLDLKVAEAGDAEELVEGPKKRVESIKAQMKVLDDEEKKAKKQGG